MAIPRDTPTKAAFALCTAALLGFTAPCAAINRCIDAAGKATYQDAACPNNTKELQFGANGRPASPLPPAPPAPPARPAPPAPSAPGSWAPQLGKYAIMGSWRGTSQSRVGMRSKQDPQSSWVLTLDPAGAVYGTIEGLKCAMAGTIAPSNPPSPRVILMRFTLSGCRDPRYNASFVTEMSTDLLGTEAFISAWSGDKNTPPATVVVLSGSFKR